MDDSSVLSAGDSAPALIDIQALSLCTGVSVPTLRRWVRNGQIDCFQPGGKRGRLLFHPDAIERSRSNPPADVPAESQAGPTILAGAIPKWMC